MTAKELYECDADFLALMADWVETRWAPYALGDFLEERGLPAAAHFARWAYEQPERPVLSDRSRTGRLFPVRWGENTGYTLVCYEPPFSAHHLPTRALSGGPAYQDGGAPLEAILAVMGRWVMRTG